MNKIQAVFTFLIIILSSSKSQAESFNFFIQKINSHEMIKMLDAKAGATREMGEMKGSWGDPRFKIAANNLPKKTLKRDETPMSGIQYAVMQKIVLSTKYGNIEKSYSALADAIDMDKEQRKRILKSELWNQAIELEKVEKDLSIYKENLEWVEKILKISKKLYSNGKLAQQGLLDIQIRKSRNETSVSNMEYRKKEVESFLGYLAGAETAVSLDLETVPWKKIHDFKNTDQDFAEKKLTKEFDASKLNLKSSKQSFVPDVTIGLAYTKREDIDNKGDFVGASLTFPLPFSGQKYANHNNAVHRKMMRERSLRNYQLKKRSKLVELTHKKSRLNKELEILVNKTLNFAKSSRDVTSRSYRLGNASYIELLNSEIQLQSFLLMKSNMESKLKKLMIITALLSGAHL